MSRTRIILTVVFALSGAGCGAGAGATPRESSTIAPVVQPAPADRSTATSAKRQATVEAVATPAGFNTATPATQPIDRAPPTSLADAFDAQLQHQINPE